MSVTPFSFIDYVAAGGAQTNFAIVRPRISNTHLRVFKNGVLIVLTTDYTIVGDDVVLNVAATDGDLVRIERRTPQTARVVDFQAGGTLTEQDLDNSALQNLYLVQEALDNVLQLQDQPTVVVNWNETTLPVLVLATWDEFASSRRTPTLGTVLGTGQPWIRVDTANKEVDLAPGKYRIDVNQVFTNKRGGGLSSSLSAAIGNDQDGAGSVIQLLLINDRPFAVADTLTGTYLVNLTAETALTFKAAVTQAGGDIDFNLPAQWIITRLGGDPALN